MTHKPSSPDTAEQLWNEYCDQLEHEPSAQGAISFAFGRLCQPATPNGGETELPEVDQKPLREAKKAAMEKLYGTTGSPSSAGTEELNKIVEQAEWYVGYKAHAGLAYHLAKHWPQIRAGLYLNAAQPSAGTEARAVEVIQGVYIERVAIGSACIRKQEAIRIIDALHSANLSVCGGAAQRSLACRNCGVPLGEAFCGTCLEMGCTHSSTEGK